MTANIPVRARFNRRAVTTIALLAVWWLTCVLYVASRSEPVSTGAKWAAERTAPMLAVKVTNPARIWPLWSYPRSSWPSQETLRYGYGYRISDQSRPDEPTKTRLARLISYARPWAILDGVPIGLILPVHAALCGFIVWFAYRCGFPRLAPERATRFRVFRQVFWSTAWRGAIWMSLPFFIAAYWFHASNPLLAMRGQPPTLKVAIIESTPIALSMPMWGAILGYFGSVIHVARVSVWRSTPQAESQSAQWITRCIRCGYHASVHGPCPECGDPHPLAIGFLYFHELHARLARRCRIDPLRILHAGIVVGMFTWPFLAGSVRNFF